MELLLSLDHYLFEIIHFSWQNELLDGIMPVLRNKWTWFPLYIILAIYWIKINRTAGLLALLCFGLTVGIADLTSSRLVKKQVKRERPCRVYKEIRGLVSCGGGYSFTSSHATNHAAMATFVFLLVGNRWGNWKWGLLLWAGLVGLAQVYVGVHYPADVMGGFLLGALLAYLMYKLYLRLPGKLRFMKETN